jgi:hypothetical protein
MTIYEKTATMVNLVWSERLAHALAEVRDLADSDARQLIRAETIDVPYMLYDALLEITKLSTLLLPALADGKVEESRGIMTKLNKLIQVLNGLPEINLGVPMDLADKIHSVVARLNGRWPV